MTGGQDPGPFERLPRCVLVLNEAFYRHEGRYYTQFNWWRFAVRLAGHCRALALYVLLAEGPPPPGVLGGWQP